MLLDSLKRKQRELGITDRQFAAKLGVPRATWANTRLGHKRIGETMIVAALRTFPELDPEVLFFLRRAEPAGAEAEPPASPENRGDPAAGTPTKTTSDAGERKPGPAVKAEEPANPAIRL